VLAAAVGAAAAAGVGCGWGCGCWLWLRLLAVAAAVAVARGGSAGCSPPGRAVLMGCGWRGGDARRAHTAEAFRIRIKGKRCAAITSPRWWEAAVAELLL